MTPYEMSVRVESIKDGYLVTVNLDSKDFNNSLSVKSSKIYSDLSDLSEVKQQAIDEFNSKVNEHESTTALLKDSAVFCVRS